MSAANCVFCGIVATNDPPHEIVAETARAIAFLNADPAAFGHTLVVPKAHADDIWVLEHRDAAAVWELTQAVARAALEGLHPHGLNLFQANRRAGWQSVFHFHFHVVPRWSGDDLTPNWTEPTGDRSKIGEAAELLRPALRKPRGATP